MTALFASMAVLGGLVRAMPEPHRAAVRLGVATGLLWGAWALLRLAARAARAAPGRPAEATPLDLPAPLA
jgi:hypothetical protein